MRTILNIFAWAVLGVFASVTAALVVMSAACFRADMVSNQLRFVVWGMTIGCLMFWAAWALRYLATNRHERVTNGR